MGDWVGTQLDTVGTPNILNLNYSLEVCVLFYRSLKKVMSQTLLPYILLGKMTIVVMPIIVVAAKTHTGL